MKMTLIAILFAEILGLQVSSWASAAVPMQITYQGTLKQNGIPVPSQIFNNITFAIVDASGNQLASNNDLHTPTNIPVTNGLFSVPLTIPTTIDWQNVTPYIQISIGGQVLSPPQPINSNLYSIVSQTVVDNAITTSKILDGSVTYAKLAPGAQVVTIPSGMIAMFASTCPNGWTPFTALDNRFPMGGDTYGATGGAATHVHTGQTGPASANYITFSGGNSNNASHPAHTHSFTTDPASNIPPYLTMVYCQKQ